ncbi:MAG TPA: ASKHA domain-containing protein [Candidatus Limnocylindrales bacterium]|nr:ASKHA domain-containing protein [Candidatus Limnocylindrales bacterium]
MAKVKFIPQQKEITIAEGTNLLKAVAEAGLHVEGNCAGKGTCGKCQVKIIEGNDAKPSPAEIEHLSPNALEKGWVLACQRIVRQDSLIEVSDQNDTPLRKTTMTGKIITGLTDPLLEKIPVFLVPPTINDQTADLERLLDQLPRQNLSISCRELSTIPRTLRDSAYAVTAVLFENYFLDIEPGNTADQMYGVAFDIGTTTIMGSLLDLKNGALLAVSAVTNPQNIYGADIISRINHASQSKEGLQQLQDLAIGAANDIIKDLLRETKLNQNQLYEAVAVGNTTMGHLFMGVDPTHLAPAPFIPAYQRALMVAAADLGLAIHPAGRVTFLPNIAGYIGSDTVGVIIATNLDLRQDNCVAIDIGTNGELVITARGRVITCSTAAGPAFEGAQIRHGMRAMSGAIEKVTYCDGEIRLETINGTPASGICGSGLIDAGAALLNAGLLETTGRFVDPDKNPAQVSTRLLDRLRRGSNGLEIVLVPGQDSATGEDIILTQGDIRELQLAKGAICAGLQVLLNETGLKVTDLDQVLLAGAFGSSVRTESAITIGLLPELPPEKVTAVGNAAGDGARIVLLSRSVRKRALALPKLVEHLELSTHPDFRDLFVNALAFRAVK